MKGLLKLIVLLAVIFFVSSLFKGGYYVRQIGLKTGVGFHSLADFADTLRISKFMDEKKHEQSEKDKKLKGVD